MENLSLSECIFSANFLPYDSRSTEYWTTPETCSSARTSKPARFLKNDFEMV
jgi:hypothetical protein